MQEASSNQLKLIRKLSQRKYREKEGLFIVEGERAVEQILENKFIYIESMFVSEKKADQYTSLKKCYSLSDKNFSEISSTDSPQGVLAICKIPDVVSVDELLTLQQGVIVATDAIQDPGNLGTILRTASWFGSNAILLGKGTVDVFNPKVVRSTAGATGTLSYINGDLGELLTQFEQAGWEILFLDGNPGSVSIQSISTSKKTILVVGNEANGISNELISPSRKRVLIPSKSTNKSVESLNAAVALSIALWCVNN